MQGFKPRPLHGYRPFYGRPPAFDPWLDYQRAIEIQKSDAMANRVGRATQRATAKLVEVRLRAAGLW